MSIASSNWLPAVWAAVALMVAGEANGQRGAVLPAPPAVLIDTLPRPPEGWKVVRSTAESHFMGWLQTTAVRTFEKLPDPPKPGGRGEGEAEGEPATVKVSITDTGRHRSLTAAFAEFEVGVTGPVERLRVDSHPAIAISLGEAGERLQILVEGRFLVEYLYKHMGRDDLKPWIEKADFGRIAAVPDGGKRLTRVVEVTRIDQMNPRRNRSYPLSITTTAEIEAILARQEQTGEGCP